MPLISMNYDGLQFAIIEIISGAAVKVDTAVFTNDPSSIASKDDVLTYMIHLGYLGYNQDVYKRQRLDHERRYPFL